MMTTLRSNPWRFLPLVFFWAAPLLGQTEGIATTRLTDHLYMFSTDQGSYTTNSLALVGEDGLLLVDTQARGPDALALKEAVEALGYGPPRYIILTHRHVEHIGGNELYGTDPVVISHALLPGKLTRDGFLFDEWGPETMPDITVADSLTLFFNDEEIRIVAMPVSHDDNEVAVHFKRNKVVHLSSIVNGFNFPSVDADGDPLGFPDAVGRAMELFPRDVTVVSGHNPPGEWRELPAYLAMHIQSQEAVREALEAGDTQAEMQEEEILAPWDHYAGSYVSASRWIQYLVEGMTAREESRPTLYAELYQAWKARGADSAVEEYFTLLADHPGEYDVDDLTLLLIGSRLSDRGLPADAVPFLRGSLREYPDAPLAYYAHYLLAGALHDLGQEGEAVEHCHRALELQPGYAPAQALKEEMEGHASRVAFRLPERDLFPEGIAHDPVSGDFFLGSLRKSKIIRVDGAGAVDTLVGREALGVGGILGMKVDAGRRLLWANFSQAADQIGADPSAPFRTGIHKIDLDSGRLVHSYSVPKEEQDHLLNDIALATDGTLYMTSYSKGTLYRLRPEAQELEEWLPMPEGVYTNGIAMGPDERYLFVAGNDDIYRVEIATGQVVPLAPPGGEEVGWGDGLYFQDGPQGGAQSGALIVVAAYGNGGPTSYRIQRLELSRDLSAIESVRVLDADHPAWTFPTTGALVNGQLYYIASAQFDQVDAGGVVAPWMALSDILVMSVPVT